MGDEIDPAVIQKTQDTLGKVVKKPPLTEKLLRKPPFRFLHDIVTNVVSTTGFMKNLYSPNELKAENITDKEGKINFLQKAIDVVALASEVTITVRPNKIVAGHEANKTNEFLQALAIAIQNKDKWKDSVQRVKNGEKVVAKPKKSDSSKKSSNETKDKKDKPDGKEKSSNESQERSSNKKERVPRESIRKPGHQKESKSRGNNKGSSSQENVPNVRHTKNMANGDRTDLRNERKREKHAAFQTLEHSSPKSEILENINGNERLDAETILPMANGDVNADPATEVLNSPKKVNSEGDTGSILPAKVTNSRPRSVRPPSARAPSTTVRKSIRKPVGDIVQMNNAEHPVSRPVTSMGRLRTARPSSARPPPPVVRSKQTIVEEPESKEGMNTVANVIVENEKDADDDDVFVTEEASNKLLDEDMAIPSTSALSKAEVTNMEHGSLVTQILKTKKDLEADDERLAPAKKTELIYDDKSMMSEASKKKEQDQKAREIEKMRSSIQSLTSSITPLGKMIHYLQEDVDSMQKELENWRRESEHHVQALKRERSGLQNEVEPLKAQLEELDQSVQSQLDKISAVKANILRNEEKIHKLLVAAKP